MKKIYWVSRHAPLLSQINELKNIFKEDVELIIDPQPFSSAKEIAERYKRSGCSDLVVVAPLSVLMRLVEEEGLHPLWAEMAEVADEKEAEVTVKGKHYRFAGFKRVKGVKLELEPIKV
jgi:hypothetical protein